MIRALELDPPESIFKPGIAETDEGKGPMLLDWIKDMTSDIFHIGELVPRPPTGDPTLGSVAIIIRRVTRQFRALTETDQTPPSCVFTRLAAAAADR